MYEGATLSIQLNGHIYGPIPIRCAVRQGRPVSMFLYALCLRPLLRLLEQKLPGKRIGRHTRPTSVEVYTDDITIFVTSTADFPIIKDAIHQYERVSGARLNSQKSKALAGGRWSSPETVLGIDYYPHVKILGITFWGTIEQSMNDSWVQLTGQVHTQAKKAYARDLCLAQWVRHYVHTFLLAKFWYSVQIFPAPSTYTQQLTTAITWYIWRGAIFREPVSTLQRPNKMGEWELTDIDAKCRALLTLQRGSKPGTSPDCIQIPVRNEVSQKVCIHVFLSRQYGLYNAA